MIRAYQFGSVVVGLAASGMAWGQFASMPPTALAETASKIVTIWERGKPTQKCRLLQQWTQPNGGEAYQVQAVDTGEMMTIVPSGPTRTVVGSGQGKTMAITIYHWTGHTPHALAPVPQTTVQATHIAPMPAAVAQASPPALVAQQTSALTASAAAGATTPSNGLSLFGQPSLPMPAPQGAPVPQQGTVSGPQRPSGAMTPGGAILSSPGSIHAFSDGGTGGDCCTTCKPSILERIKGIFHRNRCPTGYCPDACTPDNGPYPAEIASGEKIAPTPVAAIPRGPRRLAEIYQRSKPVNGADTSTRSEMPKPDTQKPDPLQNPAAYSPSRATAALAAVATAPAAPKVDTPLMANGKTPLGAGSVLQADEPRYVPVSTETLPDMRSPPQPPLAQLPQPNQPDLNALTGPRIPVAPSTPMSAMAGSSFGANPYATGTVASAFHQGTPNVADYSSPAMATTGHSTRPVVRVINKKRLRLNYEVKEVGPSGVSGVELWYTRDGKDWRRHESPPETNPPYLIEVQEEGLYGFTLLAKNGIGLSKEPPHRGDQPQVWVEVDLTKPTVALTDVKPEFRDKEPMLNIQWKASDKNLASQPITISYAEKADGPWQPIGSNLDNSGQYQWPLRSGSPATMYVRIEAKDLAGNVGVAQTPTPVHVDMARPTVQIVDVEP